ncbi:MAG TPA: hypothetical protein VKB27_16205 [Gammaproteobacteria bacterium]|nr:hypothetical protein [Gammaproteobacteria bacterium]
MVGDGGVFFGGRVEPDLMGAGGLAVELLSLFGKNKTVATRRYLRFVIEGMKRSSTWEDLKHQIYLGDDRFVERVISLIDANRDVSEVPSSQARPRPRQLSEYSSMEKDRNRAIARAYESGGYTLKEIASYFELHYSTVSVIVKNSKSKT